MAEVITTGSYFTYKGVRYGYGTNVQFKKEFYERTKDVTTYFSYEYNTIKYVRSFSSIKIENGKEVWRMGYYNTLPFTQFEYTDIVPDRDIEKIHRSVVYYEPKELVKLRINSGVWFWYIWKQTLIYALCLLISPLFQQWYLIWTIGLYAYLRLCYIELSRP